MPGPRGIPGHPSQSPEANREVTRLLGNLTDGDTAVAQRLLPLVYDELRSLAEAYFARERSDHTLQPTALVHEAFLRLVNQPDSRWESRAHFYRVAAQAMRRVLVNHARDRKRLRRGGAGTGAAEASKAETGGREPRGTGTKATGAGALKMPLEDFDVAADAERGAAVGGPDYLALDEALEKLGKVDPRKEQVVQLRYFGGFSIEDTARILDISPAQVKRDWTTARAFLIREIAGDSAGPALSQGVAP